MSKERNPNQRGVYATLDSILDTRLATLGIHYPDRVEELLLSGKYHSRSKDAFEGIDIVEFRELYDKRDLETLYHAKRTPVLDMIKDSIRGLQQEYVVEPFRGIPKLTINTYPYNTPKEFNEAFSEGVVGFITAPDMMEIEIINKDPSTITSSWVNVYYNMMFDYDALQWSDAIGESFKEVRIPDVMVIAPALDLRGDFTPEVEAKMLEEYQIHPFRALCLEASVLFNLQLVPVKYFSLTK